MRKLFNTIFASILLLGGYTSFAKTFCQENHVYIKDKDTGKVTNWIMIIIDDWEFNTRNSYCFKNSHNEQVDCWLMERALHRAFVSGEGEILDDKSKSGKMSCLN